MIHFIRVLFCELTIVSGVAIEMKRLICRRFSVGGVSAEASASQLGRRHLSWGVGVSALGRSSVERWARAVERNLLI